MSMGLFGLDGAGGVRDGGGAMLMRVRGALWERGRGCTAPVRCCILRQMCVWASPCASLHAMRNIAFVIRSSGDAESLAATWV